MFTLSDFCCYFQDGYCHVDNVTLTGKITGYINVTTGDQDALKVALAKHGPISIAIDASRKTFSFYSNGVYYDPECREYSLTYSLLGSEDRSENLL